MVNPVLVAPVEITVATRQSKPDSIYKLAAWQGNSTTPHFIVINRNYCNERTT